MSITFKKYLEELTPSERANEIQQLNESIFFTDKDKIAKWLREQNIGYFHINDDLTVDVEVSVDLSNKSLTHLPVRFNNVQGDFRCEHNKLVTLEGVPKRVEGQFIAYHNKTLTSYEHLPFYVEFDMWLGYDGVTSLRGIDFENSHWCHRQGAGLRLDFSKIKSYGLGLVLVNGLTHIINITHDQSTLAYYDKSSLRAFEIINKYLQDPTNIYDCQNELLDGGFDDFAKL